MYDCAVSETIRIGIVAYLPRVTIRKNYQIGTRRLAQIECTSLGNGDVGRLVRRERCRCTDVNPWKVVAVDNAYLPRMVGMDGDCRTVNFDTVVVLMESNMPAC